MSSGLHLTREQLVSLTGYSQGKRMCAWLDARGWVYEPPARRGALPKVSRAYHDARLSGLQPTPQQPRRGRLNLDWMLAPTPI